MLESHITLSFSCKSLIDRGASLSLKQRLRGTPPSYTAYLDRAARPRTNDQNRRSSSPTNVAIVTNYRLAQLIRPCDESQQAVSRSI
jgi:hypothetical protein